MYTIRGFCGQGTTNVIALDGPGDELQFYTLATAANACRLRSSSWFFNIGERFA